MLVPLQPKGARLEGDIPILQVTLAHDTGEPLQSGKVYPCKKGLVKATIILLKGLEQLPKQLLTLLISEVEDVPEGIHNGIDAAQPIEIPLTIGAPALRHQLLCGAGEGRSRGGGKPGATRPPPVDLKWLWPVWRWRRGAAERLGSNKVGNRRSAQGRGVTKVMSVAPQMQREPLGPRCAVSILCQPMIVLYAKLRHTKCRVERLS